MRKWIASKETVFAILVLVFISAVVYLPLIRQTGYMNDDWYLMYSAKAYGPSVFVDIFSVDRPARALIMMPAYGLFGENPVYYNLSAYVFRIISGVAFLWLLRMLFPRQIRWALLGSLLFILYPGFLSQYNGIDYQSQMISLAAAMLSVALSIKVVLMDGGWGKVALVVLSVLFGWLYLGLVEYFIGFEFLRWGSVLLLSLRMGGSLLQKMWRAIRSMYLSLLVPIIFLIWRIFFFQAERTATDVNVQFENVKLYPLQTLYHWMIQVLQDLFDVLFAAWFVPLSQLTGYIQRWGIVLAVVLAGLLFYFFSSQKNDDDQDMSSKRFIYEALALGIFIGIGGLLPIAMVNRGVSFPSYSRYSLVSSAGVVIFLSTVLMLLRQRVVRNGLIALLIFISVLTHHANAIKAVQQTAFTRDFWWQVSWRVPQFEMNTTLVANYPGVVLEEDYFIWGPANLIYYPEKQNEKNIQPGLFAAILNSANVDKILARERQEYGKRKNIITYTNYRNILVMTQPGVDSCVHIIDGAQPEYSDNEWDFVRETEPYSEIEHVLIDETPHTPPTVVFGPEPVHGWCYYYQKANLARQRGEWDKVQSIGDQAFSQGFEPKDAIEWIPFLQAYAINENTNQLVELAPLISADAYVSEQVCRIFKTMPGLSNAVLKTIESEYCFG